MPDADDSPENKVTAKRRGLGKAGWAATLILALAAGGGGFYATFSGKIGAHTNMVDADTAATDHGAAESGAPTFLELDPLMVSVGGAGSIRQLRFRAFLQLGGDQSDVAALQPRILDIFATYLRAVSVEQLQDPTSLLHLRAQLLRRVQLLAGSSAVDDLLIIDFVIT